MHDSWYLIGAFVVPAVVSYALGSIPTALWLGRFLRGIDIREHGSGNAGATNVLRVLGWRPAVFVLLLDGAKGWLAAAVIAPTGAAATPLEADAMRIVAGGAAVAGHISPVFAGFRGGKGVATAAGLVLALDPGAFVLVLGVFAIVVVISRRVALASMLAAVTLPLAFLVSAAWQEDPAVSRLRMGFGLLLVVVVTWAHRSNIRNLVSGREPRIG